jgi:hypothetical protein
MQSIYGLLPIFVRNVKSYFGKLYGEDDFAKAAVSATLKRDRIWPGEGYGEGFDEAPIVPSIGTGWPD